ncbi:MAG: hypothetical protein IK009_07815 [Bacteroidales bacterium]|nr:hypothetical protein [Bacteroidales bacterium]
MKKVLSILFLLTFCMTGTAQTVQSQVVEGGGTGPFKAIVVNDASAPAFTIYRPADLEAATQQGKLPVIVYANGGCANNNVEMRFLLNEVASYGYVLMAIGPYDEDDVNEKWKSTLPGWWPDGKKVVLSSGEEVAPPTAEAIRAREEQTRREIERNRPQAGNNPGAAPRQQTYSRQLLEALDWLTDQNASPKSEYYHMLDLEKAAAMGQSCGGTQVLGIAHDPRLTTCVILNSGIGDMEMQGTTVDNLKNLHTPMFYLIGGPGDVAFQNSAKDYARIEGVPIVMMNTHDGHLGTYYERHGGAFAVAVRKWLDWQLKGDTENAPFFMDDAVMKAEQPDWSVVRKGWSAVWQQ